MPGIHHVELWVANFETSRTEWAWLLAAVGFTLDASWPLGETWAAGGAYLTLTTPPAVSDAPHDRRLPGMNHIALNGGSSSDVDRIMGEAASHGWHPLYTARYPHAGGPDHYAGWLENSAGFKVEVVAE